MHAMQMDIDSDTHTRDDLHKFAVAPNMMNYNCC